MTDITYNKIMAFVHKYDMIKEGDLVAAGVSGGADSVCMLHLLHRMRAKIPYRLIVVHVNHGIREDAARDAAYVERLCREWEIPFYLRQVDMEGYAKEHGMSPEEAGRSLRYKMFWEILQQERQKEARCRIAVAHNANDRAETMLFHLFRGSGIRGLASIRPVKESVIRPLLCLDREEVEEYLAGQQLGYCHDSTNDEDAYTRNRIRHHILPYAESEICSGSIAHMGELADVLMETEDYLAKQTKKLYECYVREIYTTEQIVEEESTEELSGVTIRPDERPLLLRITCGQLLAQDPVMYKRVLFSCLERFAPHGKDITAQHIADLVNLMRQDGTKELALPYKINACKEYDRLFLYQSVPEGKDHAEGKGETIREEYAIVPPAQVCIPGQGTFTFTIMENDAVFREKQQNIPENRYTKWFDYDKITTSALLRTRRQGDYLTIDTALHTKSVKQYMINEKIPRAQRDRMYLLADGPHVLWIPGYRISQHYKVDESTKRILQVQLRGGFHGRTN